MTKKKVKAKPKNGIYKTDDGAKLLLDTADPKYRKPAKKPVRIIVHAAKPKHLHKAYKKVRPLIGFAATPYLLVRPVIKKASNIGNQQFDKVFHDNT